MSFRGSERKPIEAIPGKGMHRAGWRFLPALIVVGVLLVLGLCAVSIAIVVWIDPILGKPETSLDPQFTVVEFQHTGKIRCLEFSPDGRFLAAGGEGTGQTRFQVWDGNVFIWDTFAQRELHSPHLPQWVVSLSFHPDGRYQAISSSASNKIIPDTFNNFKQTPGQVIIYQMPVMNEVNRLQIEVLSGPVRFSPGRQDAGSCPSSRHRSRGSERVDSL